MNRESLNILLKKAYCQQLSEEERETLKLWLGESGENAEMYKRLMSEQSLTEYSDWVTGFDLSRAMEAIRSKVKRNRQRKISKLGGCLCNTLSGHNFRFLFHFNGFRTGIDRTNGCSDTAWLGKGDIDFRGWTASGFG